MKLKLTKKKARLLSRILASALDAPEIEPREPGKQPVGKPKDRDNPLPTFVE